MSVDVTTITVAQFEAQFPRGFPFLDAITYNNSAIYNVGAKVYYPPTNQFYSALANGVTGILPNTLGANWQLEDDDPDNYVQDGDITNAFGEAQAVFNTGLYPTDAVTTLCYLYLTAHFLASDLKTALEGVVATGSFPVASKSAGSVSEVYSIPQAYLENPILTPYTSTAYGMKYLAMTLPRLVGNVGVLPGGALP